MPETVCFAQEVRGRKILAVRVWSTRMDEQQSTLWLVLVHDEDWRVRVVEKNRQKSLQRFNSSTSC